MPNMVSEPLLWPFLSSLVFISVTPFSTSLPSSQQPPQLFAIEPLTSSSRRPWVLDLQPPSLRSFTLHRPLPFASPLQTLLRLRFWRYHRDRLALIYKLVKASTPSETLLCAAQSFCMVDHTPHAPPRAVSSDHTPPRVVTRPHALANVIHVSFYLAPSILCWRGVRITYLGLNLCTVFLRVACFGIIVLVQSLFLLREPM